MRREFFINGNFYGADIRRNSLIISKEAVVYPEKSSRRVFFNDRTGNYARTGLLERFTPSADAMAHSTFQERFRGIAKSLNDYSRPYIGY